MGSIKEVEANTGIAVMDAQGEAPLGGQQVCLAWEVEKKMIMIMGILRKLEIELEDEFHVWTDADKEEYGEE